MPTLPVIVYGNGGLFREYFNAVVALFGTHDFTTLYRMSILFSGVCIVFSFITQRSLMIIVKWFGLCYLSMFVIFVPKASVVIIDRVNGDLHYAVDNVPLGFAIIASYSSVIGDSLTRNFESNFSMPDYLPYHKSGMVFASRMVEASTQFEITEARFDENLKEFMHQCVFYDVLLHKYTIDDLVQAKNIWELVSTNASPARSFIYDGQITTCKAGVLNLTKDWPLVIKSSIANYSKRIYPNLSKEQAKTQFLKDLPLSYSYLTKLSDSASEIIQQNLMSNAIQRGVLSMNARLNANAALESYALVRAQEQKRLTNKTLGEMSAYWLPLMKNAMEAIMYGLFIIVILLSVFPFGLTILKNYAFTLMWIQIWAPLYAIINLIVSFYAQSESVAAADGNLCLSHLSGILQINSDISGLAGYLTLSVPFLSAGIVKGMASTFSQLAQYVGGVTQSAGGAGAQEAITGNMSFGNTSLSNHNAYNTSANHLDSSGRVSSGMITTQLIGGSSMSIMPDGSTVLDMKNSMSNLGASINFAEALRSSYSNQAERSFSAAMSDANVYGTSMSAALRDISDLSHQYGNTEATSRGWSVSTNTGTTEALGNIKRLTEDFAQRHHLSYNEAASVLSSAYVDGKLAGSIGVDSGRTLPGKALELATGLKGSISGQLTGGVSRSASHTNSTDYGALFSDAKSFISDHNYSENVDLVTRAAKDQSLRLSSESGTRLVNNLNASLDKAENARHEMQSHFSESESARAYANLSEEKGQNINSNANQQFYEWMAHQPGTNGQGKMGHHAIESIQKDPNLSMQYATQFLEQYKSTIEKDWNKDLPAKVKNINATFDSNNHAIKQKDYIENDFHKNSKNLEESGYKEGLSRQNHNEENTRQKVEKDIQDNKRKIVGGHGDIEKEELQGAGVIREEEGRVRHGNLIKDIVTNIDTHN